VGETRAPCHVQRETVAKVAESKKRNEDKRGRDAHGSPLGDLDPSLAETQFSRLGALSSTASVGQ
jgi:hypothetical protein